MNRYILLFIIACTFSSTSLAQDRISLKECRSMALKRNKSLVIGQIKQQQAYYNSKAAKTNYLPKISATAGYLYTNNEISILNDKQKSSLSNIGTNLTGKFGEIAGNILQQHPELAPLIQAAGQYMPQVGQALNGVGKDIVDAFRTDTRNMMGATILLSQPLYMGGKIRAYHKITRYAEEIAGEQLRADEQETLLEVDQAYWQVVSLANKKKLATDYLKTLKNIHSDILKMIDEGVATKANELSVSVKVNEAEMTLTKVEDGLTLSRMLLNQICGLPIDTSFLLYDETLESLPLQDSNIQVDTLSAFLKRPEIQQLERATDLYKEKVKIERSAFLPHLALTGGYLTTYPGLTNGFEKRFRGTWNVGVMLSLPLWNWGEGYYKVKAAKADATIAQYEMADAKEKITLQLHQAAFRVNEAQKKLAISLKNEEKATENLRVAQLGFKEGVIPTSDLLAAQTAWLQAQSEKIDAQIDIKLNQVFFNKAQGTLSEQ